MWSERDACIPQMTTALKRAGFLFSAWCYAVVNLLPCMRPLEDSEPNDFRRVYMIFGSGVKSLLRPLILTAQKVG
jgi:hypothetical protein